MAGLINYVKKAFKNYPNTTTKISAENLNHLDNGIFNLDQAAKSAIDDINNNMESKVDNFTSGTYSPVTGLSYDTTNKKLGLKVNGADTVIPFSGGGAKLVGTYSSNTTVDVSSYGATSASQFLAVPIYQDVTSNYGGNSYTGSGPYYPFVNVTLKAPTLSLSNNQLTVNVAQCTASGGAHTPPHQFTNTFTLSTKIYYVGDIS